MKHDEPAPKSLYDDPEKRSPGFRDGGYIGADFSLRGRSHMALLGENGPVMTLPKSFFSRPPIWNRPAMRRWKRIQRIRKLWAKMAKEGKTPIGRSITVTVTNPSVEPDWVRRRFEEAFDPKRHGK